ncbi:MAG: ABC transporter permease [Blastochloris sp.]|nr:ABC transporter permease [Blastochloris sp.]
MDVSEPLRSPAVPEPATPSAVPIPDERDDLEALELNQDSQRVATASQWQLIWWRFRKNRLAVFCVGVVALFYLTAIFADAVAPYDPNQAVARMTLAPPSRIYFLNEQGRPTWPYAYGLGQSVNRETFRREFAEDPAQRTTIGLFVSSEPYRLWGFIPLERRLIGPTNPEVRIYLLGGDTIGRDLLSRMTHATRISMSISLIGILLSLIIGVTLGGVSGYYGGGVDMAIQRLIEFLDSIPKIPIWMGLSAAIPLTWSPLAIFFGITLILSLLGWLGMARVVRGRFLALREEDFVMAALVAGANERRIIFRHMLPAFTSHIVAALTLSIPGAILGETSLSFLNLGLKPPLTSFGVLLQEAQNLRTVALAPWLIIPALALIVLVLAFNYLGDGLRDAADPYA